MINIKTCNDKYYKIFDKEGQLVASGKCIGSKPNFIKEGVIYISFDNKWFYGNKNCKIEEVEYVDNFIPEKPVSSLIWDYWRNNERGTEVDVYREFNYDEIDPPIKPYIDRLNKISPFFSTVDSCCGHNIENWHVGFIFHNISILSDFLEIVNEFNNDLVLISNCHYLQFGRSILLKLCVNEKRVIKDFDLLLLDKFVNRLERKMLLKY